MAGGQTGQGFRCGRGDDAEVVQIHRLKEIRAFAAGGELYAAGARPNFAFAAPVDLLHGPIWFDSRHPDFRFHDYGKNTVNKKLMLTSTNMKIVTRPASALFLRTPLLAVALAASASGLAAQNLLVNSGFETFTVTVNTAVPITAGVPNTSAVTGWTIQSSVNSSVGITNIATVSQGAVYFSFNVAETAPSVASIYQDFTTTPGASYLVSFDVGRFGGSGGSVASLGRAFDVVSGVINGGALGSDTKSSTTANGGAFASFFASSSFSFVAVGNTSRLVISDASAVTGNVDLVVDKASVTLTAIPEPSSYAAIAGTVLLGFAALRRRRAVSA